MTIQQQAYINGFVKRATEHGLSAYEAIEILKLAAPAPRAWRAVMRDAGARSLISNSATDAERAAFAKKLRSPAEGKIRSDIAEAARISRGKGKITPDLAGE
jgi:hypothetical protein